MDRRTAERLARRIEVRFWRRGNPQVHTGFTIDLSKSGIFLGTAQQLDLGERIRLELVDRDRGFTAEGQVARVHRVSLTLQHVEQPGVGVKFLTPAELVQELLRSRGKDPAPLSPAAAAPAPPPSPPPAKSTASTGSFAPPAPGRDRPVVVEFVDRSSFLTVYHRDIASGGLFVTTSEPTKLHEIVTVELRTPIATEKPLRFEARVVHCLDAPPDGRGGGGGVGVQFLEPDRVRAALATILSELRD